jgi:hypothetical protein
MLMPHAFAKIASARRRTHLAHTNLQLMKLSGVSSTVGLGAHDQSYLWILIHHYRVRDLHVAADRGKSVRCGMHHKSVRSFHDLGSRAR